ncbi:MAG: hypothetical protein ACE5KL_02175, partial [Alphaproteobacteria bacterium]
MLRAVRNIARVVRIARTLARHGALSPLEKLGIAPAVTAWARLVTRRKARPDLQSSDLRRPVAGRLRPAEAEADFPPSRPVARRLWA